MTALLAWNPTIGGRGTTPDEVLYQYAEAIASVCESDIECLTMASIASEESHFAPSVLSGECNRTRHRCDHGQAYGAWQMHQFSSTSLDMLHTGINEQAAIVVKLYRKMPYAWTTHRIAEYKARKWLREHPIELAKE